MTNAVEVPAVEVRGLRVDVADTGSDIVRDIDLSVASGSILAVVGESGSGKTTVGSALLGFARRGARIVDGSVKIGNHDVLDLKGRSLQAVRGAVVGYVPQDPSTAMNPALRIRSQLLEMLKVHAPNLSEAQRSEQLRTAMAEVKLPSDDAFLRRFPHQLSGGQLQRCSIAMAFLLRPQLVVLDEPTTGLDVTTQAHVLATVADLCRSHQTAVVYITHDLAVVGDIADSVMVMYAGRVVERGALRDVFREPAHPYTRALLSASPDITRAVPLVPLAGHAPTPGNRVRGCEFSPRCAFVQPRCLDVVPPDQRFVGDHVSRCHRAAEVKGLTFSSPLSPVTPSSPTGAPAVLKARELSAGYGARTILSDVTLELAPGECLALVGESGSGKTTLVRTLVGLLPPRAGQIELEDRRLAPLARHRDVEARRTLQYIFQNPYSSLNPRQTVSQILTTPIRHFFGLRGRGAHQHVIDALAKVALPSSVAQLHPHELSGGERQRVAIARALACDPRVLICDEITSALDVSVQAGIVALLQTLRETSGLSVLFVTHNLPLVRTIADRVAVLHQGVIVELGQTNSILDAPGVDYTRQLIADTPSIAQATIEAPTPTFGSSTP